MRGRDDAGWRTNEKEDHGSFMLSNTRIGSAVLSFGNAVVNFATFFTSCKTSIMPLINIQPVPPTYHAARFTDIWLPDRPRRGGGSCIDFMHSANSVVDPAREGLATGWASTPPVHSEQRRSRAQTPHLSVIHLYETRTLRRRGSECQPFEHDNVTPESSVSEGQHSIESDSTIPLHSSTFSTPFCQTIMYGVLFSSSRVPTGMILSEYVRDLGRQSVDLAKGSWTYMLLLSFPPAVKNSKSSNRVKISL
jgi:hypothetical protein